MNERPAALITGGAKRVGRAIVERLAGAGFDVAFSYNGSESAARALVESLEKQGRRAHAKQVDLGKADSAEMLAAWVRGVLPRVDLLVNNASMYVPDDSDAGASAGLAMSLMNVNYHTPANLIMQLTPDLKSAGGLVVNMVDLLASRPWPKYSAYCASKAALQNFTVAVARKLAPEARAVGIAPGVVDWPDDMPQAVRDAYLEKVPLRRAGTPRDVANLVHFLATEGTYITGQIIALDGGRSIV